MARVKRPGIYANVSVDLPDDPRVIEAGPMLELVYLRCVLRSRKHLTDGVIDRRALPLWLFGVPGNHVKLMERLQAIGLVNRHKAGWCIPLDKWQQWNPTAREVAEKRAQDRERQDRSRGSKPGETPGRSTDCHAPVTRDTAVTSANNESMSRAVIVKDRDIDRVILSQSATLSQPACGQLRDDEDGGLSRVTQHIGTHLAERNKARSPRAYAAKCAKEAAVEYGSQIVDLCRRYPTAAASQIAAYVLGEKSALNYCQPDEQE